jgi:hypothetical protein
VRTSGETHRAPDASGAWQLESCFGAPTSIGAALHAHTTWAPGLYW